MEFNMREDLFLLLSKKKRYAPSHACQRRTIYVQQVMFFVPNEMLFPFPTDDKCEPGVLVP